MYEESLSQYEMSEVDKESSNTPYERNTVPTEISIMEESKHNKPYRNNDITQSMKTLLNDESDKGDELSPV